ncbi:MAG: phosphatase PAP2 family protein [Desulfovibrionaceae bacterium]|nr:phosphatase PAP2 family protein [Desulfovibrionaceae bacterium]
MRTSLKHWALYSAPLLLMLAAVWLACGSEAAVAEFFKDHRAAHPVLKTCMKALTDWSNPVFYAGYGAALILAWKSGNRQRVRFILIVLAVQAVVAGLAVHFLKQTIGRPRPGQGEWFDPLTTRGAQHSLPSGHTTEIVGWSLPLALRLRRYLPTAALSLFIGLLGFSRVYLGWHHPSDVFFGWLLGSFGGLSAMVIADSTLFTPRR